MRSFGGSRPFCCLTLIALTLLGCGWGGTIPLPVVPPTVPKPLGYTLGGNWLLYGTLPSLSELNANAKPGAVFSFDVQNGVIHGSATVEAACSGGGFVNKTYVNGLTGAVNKDGTFTASSGGAASPSSDGIIVTGTVPTSVGMPWQGTYTISSTQNCTYSIAGSFTAQPVGDVTGTFVGDGNVEMVLSSTSLAAAVPLHIQMTVRQQTYVSSVATSNDQELLGDVVVSGIPCFSTGTTTPPFSGGYVAGDNIFVGFQMDDGSSLSLAGSILDLHTTKVGIASISVSGGNCAGNYVVQNAPLILSR